MEGKLDSGKDEGIELKEFKKENRERILNDLYRSKAHIRLYCDYSEKELVKENGAFWNVEGKYWYVTNVKSFLSCNKWIKFDDILQYVYKTLIAEKTAKRIFKKVMKKKKIKDSNDTKKQKTIDEYFDK